MWPTAFDMHVNCIRDYCVLHKAASSEVVIDIDLKRFVFPLLLLCT